MGVHQARQQRVLLASQVLACLKARAQLRGRPEREDAPGADGERVALEHHARGHRQQPARLDQQVRGFAHLSSRSMKTAAAQYIGARRRTRARGPFPGVRR